jgi:mono/diheme cytochrome c family protein
VYDPRVAGRPPRTGPIATGGNVLRINALTIGTVAVATVAAVWIGSTARGADVSAGKVRFNAACGSCHDAADFEGENPQALVATLRRLASGELKHKKPLQLSDSEMADVAAYMSTGGK